MSLFIPLPRLTVLVPSGPVHDLDRMHLYVVLTPPQQMPDGSAALAWVCVRSLYPDSYHEPTCVLQRGDHDFIVRPSWVDYARAAIEHVDFIDKGIRNGQLAQKAPMSPVVFQKVFGGLTTSKRTPRMVKDFCLFASL